MPRLVEPVCYRRTQDLKRARIAPVMRHIWREKKLQTPIGMRSFVKRQQCCLEHHCAFRSNDGIVGAMKYQQRWRRISGGDFPGARYRI